MGRMQSPSSINCYKQCPRKYFYRYVQRLPTKPSIHLVRGRIVHSVLEDFYDEVLGDDWQTETQRRALSLLEKHWDALDDEFKQLDETPEELDAYKQETVLMVVNWVKFFSDKMNEQLSVGKTVADAFAFLTPQREVDYRDPELNVRGYIDAVETNDDGVHLIDYKTSKKPQITEEYRLQLGIYALMYLRRHQKIPEKVGVHFLRHDLQLMEVNDELLLDAQFEIEQIHMLTESTSIADYPKKEGPLCNWCDYYDKCFGQKTLE